MVVNQGDIFWIELDEPSGSEPGYRRPHLVVQNNLFCRCARLSCNYQEERIYSILLLKPQGDRFGNL